MASFLDKDGLEYLWNKIKPWIPKKTSDIQNDSGFISTETDPTVPSWAKAATKPSYTAGEVGAVPTSRKVNNKPLTTDITITAEEIAATDAGGNDSDVQTVLDDVQTELTGKSNTGHTHDDRYYTETEIKDFVVEYGTSSNWTWQKWNSGFCEWTYFYSGAPTTGSHYTITNGFYGYYLAGIYFPSGCKPKDGNYVVDADWKIGNGFALSAERSATGDTNSFNLYALGTAARQTTVNIRIKITGKWK